MPHLTSFSSSYYSYTGSPRSDWSDYMDDTDNLLYEPSQPTYVGMIDDGDNLSNYEINDDIFNLSHTISTRSTASGKQFVFDKDLSTESHRRTWTSKDLRQWNAYDIMDWISYTAKCHNYNYEKINMSSFNVDGHTLYNMTESEFTSRAPEFGKELYLSLQYVINGNGYETNSQLPGFNPSFRQEREKLPSLPLGLLEDTETLTELNVYKAPEKTRSTTTELNLDVDSDSSSVIVPPKPLKRLPGRPRGTRSKKKPEKKTGRLWEFIRDLLLNREYCPSLICWDDHNNGVFRFVHSEKVANLWGTIKENPKMTYEKLSRAMRYYYKSKVLQPVLGRRLVYKFGPTATGWRTPNPNFRLSD